jgi:hypothetical protein
MAKTSEHVGRNDDQPDVLLQPPRPRRRLRPSFALVPLALALAAWILGSVQPAVAWDDILRLLRIPDQDKERFSMLIVLILTSSSILLIKHIAERR